MSEGKIVSVLFTRYYSKLSTLFYYISGRGYTHASIALDEENEYYYSFCFKGFRRECPRKYKKISKKSVICRLEVSQEEYLLMEQRINDMEKHRERYHYSRLGVFLCFLHIPLKRKNRYFCSQFVAEMLSMSGNISLKNNSSLYFPNQLLLELRGQDSLKEIVYDSLL